VRHLFLRRAPSANACQCGAPGAPCPICNATNDGDAPRMPGGFKTEVDKDGWWPH
jgi:hypothetical protein